MRSADLVEHEIAKIDIEHLEQRLMTSNQRTASIIESLPDMVFVIDTHHRFTRVMNILICSSQKMRFWGKSSSMYYLSNWLTK